VNSLEKITFGASTDGTLDKDGKDPILCGAVGQAGCDGVHGMIKKSGDRIVENQAQV